MSVHEQWAADSTGNMDKATATHKRKRDEDQNIDYYGGPQAPPMIPGMMYVYLLCQELSTSRLGRNMATIRFLQCHRRIHLCLAVRTVTVYVVR